MDDSHTSEFEALLPTLLARVRAAADEDHRPAGEILCEAVDRYLAQRLLKRRGRIVRPVEALSAAEIEAIAVTEMDGRHAHLDRELD